MPPPPPRPTSLPPPAQAQSKPTAPPLQPQAAPGSYHQDSQGTRINDGGGITAASLLQSEPSVNKQTAPLHNDNNNNNNNNSLADSNALPGGFFEVPIFATQGGQGSTGNGGGNMSIDMVVSKAAKSGEGSTGAALGGGGGGGGGIRSGSAGDFLVATSQYSAMIETEPALVAPAVSHAVERSQQNTTNTKTIEGGGTSSKQQQLPNGFFDTSAAVAAPTQGTKASAAAAATTDGKDVDMDKEFADFMKEVNVDATTETDVGRAGAVVENEEEEDDDDARQAREDFEQL
jgi:hypothetical protein